MKKKLYTLLTGLLMATCITSYGQEIVSEFTLQNGKLYYNTDILECSDGSLLTGISFYSNDYTESGFLICKTTPEGQLMDSVRFDNGWSFYSINGAPDSFVIPSFFWDETSDSDIFQMTFFDADLNVSETVSVPIFSDIAPNAFSIDELFLSPENDFILSYWENDEVFHLLRVNLEGTIKAESETTTVLPPHYSTGHPADSALNYTSSGFGLLTEEPFQFCKVGGYIGTSSSHPWPLIAYVFDENLNRTNTLVYDYLSEDSYFDYAMGEHIVPFHKEDQSYLFAGQIRYPDGKYKSSLVKYDMNHTPVVITSVEPTTMGGNPIKTAVVNNNTVYHAYRTHPTGNSYAISLARLDGDLNLLWNITMPGGQQDFAYGQCLKALQNGDVAIAYTTSIGSGDTFRLFIVHDSYDSTPETAMPECQFTLYPNPVNDILGISYTDNAKPTSVELYDLTGRLIYVQHNDLESIDMTELQAGIYTMCITFNDGERRFEKVVKE